MSRLEELMALVLAYARGKVLASDVERALRDALEPQPVATIERRPGAPFVVNWHVDTDKIPAGAVLLAAAPKEPTK